MQSKRTLRRMLAFISLINKLADWLSNYNLTARTFPKSSAHPPPLSMDKADSKRASNTFDYFVTVR